MRFDLLNQQISPHVMTVRPCPTPPGLRAEEVGTDHVSDHALRFSSDVSMELMYRLSFCRNCESLHPGVGLNGKSS